MCNGFNNNKKKKSEISGSYGNSVFNFFKELPGCFPKWLHHLTTPPAMYESWQKIQYHLMIKNNNNNKTRNRRKLPQPDKGHLQKPTASIMLNGERLKALPSMIRNKKRRSILVTSIQHCTRGYYQVILGK